MPVIPAPVECDEPLLAEAAQWWLRLRHCSTDETEQDALYAAIEQWRGQSQAHADAWRQVQRGWQRSAAAAHTADPADHAAAPRPQQTGAAQALVRRRPRRRWQLLGAAAAACLPLLLLPSLWLRWSADAQTANGEIRSLVLADGSTVVLDTDSAIAFDDSATTRGVRLLKGRALFQVQHDASRPFTVHSGEVSVTVTGTRFEVSRLQGTQVSLLQGSVRVRQPCSGQPCVTDLRAGQRLALDDADRPGQASALPADSAQWPQHRWTVRDTPLADVVRGLQRYGHARIVITDGELAAARITGAFDLHDPDAALDLAVQAQGGRVRQLTPWLRVVSRR